MNESVCVCVRIMGNLCAASFLWHAAESWNHVYIYFRDISFNTLSYSLTKLSINSQYKIKLLLQQLVRNEEINIGLIGNTLKQRYMCLILI